MLIPKDYTQNAIYSDVTRKLMSKIEFEHGGEEYDKLYPEAIPTSVIITTNDNKTYDSGMIKFPLGHAMNDQYL